MNLVAKSFSFSRMVTKAYKNYGTPMVLSTKFSQQNSQEIMLICVCYLDNHLQAISEENISNLLRQMPKLRVLGLHYSLGNLPSNIVHVISSNLTSLSLDRGVPWMTDASISLLGERCKGLTHLSLIGCHLLTSSKF
jgi:hypothetical protein